MAKRNARAEKAEKSAKAARASARRARAEAKEKVKKARKKASEARAKRTNPLVDVGVGALTGYGAGYGAAAGAAAMKKSNAKKRAAGDEVGKLAEKMESPGMVAAVPALLATGITVIGHKKMGRGTARIMTTVSTSLAASSTSLMGAEMHAKREAEAAKKAGESGQAGRPVQGPGLSAADRARVNAQVRNLRNKLNARNPNQLEMKPARPSFTQTATALTPSMPLQGQVINKLAVQQGL